MQEVVVTEVVVVAVVFNVVFVLVNNSSYNI